MFAAAVCVVCSIFVSSAAVLLKDRQEENKLIDRMSKVLSVAGLIDDADHPPAAEIKSLFESNITPIVIDLKTGEIAEDEDPKTFDQRAARGDPDRSRPAPKNAAKVQRLPNHALVYQVMDGEELEALIFPVEGKGLWSTLYGFLALDEDAQTIKGITFYEHGETPGLGGEVDNPSWKALWPGRKAFGEDGKPKISVKKGQAGKPEDDPYHVDGLSGATLTSRGVTHLVQFWLSDDGYGPYLDKYRKQKGIR
jgi:Na+-transporting NADH:ubiquinone oxidoreductase subunit C